MITVKPRANLACTWLLAEASRPFHLRRCSFRTCSQAHERPPLCEQRGKHSRPPPAGLAYQQGPEQDPIAPRHQPQDAKVAPLAKRHASLQPESEHLGQGAGRARWWWWRRRCVGGCIVCKAPPHLIPRCGAVGVCTAPSLVCAWTTPISGALEFLRGEARHVWGACPRAAQRTLAATLALALARSDCCLQHRSVRPRDTASLLTFFMKP